MSDASKSIEVTVVIPADSKVVDQPGEILDADKAMEKLQASVLGATTRVLCETDLKELKRFCKLEDISEMVDLTGYLSARDPKAVTCSYRMKVGLLLRLLEGLMKNPFRAAVLNTTASLAYHSVSQIPDGVSDVASLDSSHMITALMGHIRTVDTEHYLTESDMRELQRICTTELLHNWEELLIYTGDDSRIDLDQSERIKHGTTVRLFRVIGSSVLVLQKKRRRVCIIASVITTAVFLLVVLIAYFVLH